MFCFCLFVCLSVCSFVVVVAVVCWLVGWLFFVVVAAASAAAVLLFAFLCLFPMFVVAFSQDASGSWHLSNSTFSQPQSSCCE